jgi:hypothetical protein
MLPSQKNLTVAAAIVLGCCGVAESGDGPCAASPCHSPICGPCFPERASYGYFPTTWRRWPTERVEPARGQQPEALPTPAEPAPPPPTPEIPETPLEPTQPAAPGPEQPQALPVEPPFGEPPAKPPADENPLELPFEAEPPPLNDAPPALPTEPKDSLLSPFDPTKAPEAMPSEELPEPEKSPAPESDSPPTMPDDDPFKDDPRQDTVPPAEPAPKSSARDEFERIRQQASSRWQSTAEAPGQLRESPALPLGKGDEPRRLEADGDKTQSPMSPGLRDNPLRSASRPGRARKIVPTASFSAADAATGVGRGARWRPNPLRSN